MAAVSAFGDGRLDEALSAILQLDARTLNDAPVQAQSRPRLTASGFQPSRKVVATLATALALGLLIGSGAVIWTHMPHGIDQRDFADAMPRFDRFTTTRTLRSATPKPNPAVPPPPLVEIPQPEPAQLAKVAPAPPAPAAAAPAPAASTRAAAVVASAAPSVRAVRRPATPTAAPSPQPQSTPSPGATPNPSAVAAAAKFVLPSLSGDVQATPPARQTQLASAGRAPSPAAPAEARPAAQPSPAPAAAQPTVVTAPSARARRDGVDAMRSLRQQW